VASYDSSYNRNPNRLDHFDPKNFSIFEHNDLAYLDYDRSYDHTSVIVQTTVMQKKNRARF